MNDTPKSRWIAEALDLHQASLVRYAAWILGDVDSAREIVQETFLRLCREQPAKVSGHLAQCYLRFAVICRLTREERELA